MLLNSVDVDPHEKPTGDVVVAVVSKICLGLCDTGSSQFPGITCSIIVDVI